MKYLSILLFSCMLQTPANSQPDTAAVEKYEIAVSFGSMCCGPVSDAFLKDFIRQFSSKNKVIIPALQIGGCGREGEFKILFSVKKLNASGKKKLLAGLKKLIPQENEKNKKLKAGSGPVSLEYDLPKSQLVNCRGELTKWK